VSLKVFVDSDVIISSLLSSSGAAHFLLHNTDAVKPCISNLSLQEIRIVVERLAIDSKKLASLYFYGQFDSTGSTFSAST